MFDNIGNKIKALAQVECWIGIIACIISGIVFTRRNIIVGLLIVVVGSLLSWIGSFLLYGFGQLIDNSDIIAEQSIKASKREKKSKVKDQLNNDMIPDTTYIDIYCPNCHEMLSYTKQQLIENDTWKCPICDKQFSTAQYK